ncbi:hypothetical protein GZ77_17885 [Endozoicomonas montiporae]|uniref:Uncharacterized protein n=2 Tax=Endozoicomonas montiporae TaxID=1027273 RepID=A0A081N1T6_9GAMM|nr:hypothetical protein [Endozoicomonas montiporae]AMO58649.1 hypothetical protein EZMO1_4748 [Endozoicomonas montiporae CL-33]KEQ12409.1 hypothetical protein GZ77_17885 [Endozoicomonas montiporae]
MTVQMPSFRSLFLGLLFVSMCSVAQEASWETVGSAKARSTRQTITIPIPESFQSKNIKSIRLHVSKGDIKANYVRLTLNDGDKIDASIQRMIRSGNNSRIIPVEINGRTIKKVSLNYGLQSKETVLVSLQVQLANED